MLSNKASGASDGGNGVVVLNSWFLVLKDDAKDSSRFLLESLKIEDTSVDVDVFSFPDARSRVRELVFW